MGFLNSLRSVSNFITGGGAVVTLTTEGDSVRQPLRVTVKAVVKEASIKVNRVYLQVRGEEEVVVDDVPLAKEVEQNGERLVRVEKENLRRVVETWSHEFDVAGTQTLAANSEHEWVQEVNLPANALPSYHGRKASHQWKLYAGLDTRGNDPDSGWVTVELQA